MRVLLKRAPSTLLARAEMHLFDARRKITENLIQDVRAGSVGDTASGVVLNETLGLPGSPGTPTTNISSESNVSPSGLPAVSNTPGGAVKSGADGTTVGGSHSGDDDTSPDAGGQDSFWPWVAPSKPRGAGKAAPGSGEEAMSSDIPNCVVHAGGSLDVRLSTPDSRRIDSYFASMPEQAPDVPDFEPIDRDTADRAERLDAVFTRVEGDQPALAAGLIGERGAEAASPCWRVSATQPSRRGRKTISGGITALNRVRGGISK
jgi:hypothetical protein